jgi:glycosyltransferase involved in cell wall biosynthesis
MIVRDEEESLGRCLESAEGFVDEIVVVDTGSVDKTKEIALAHGAKVYDFAWVDDFAAARNYSFSLGKKEWLFWLDADDVIPKASMEKLKALKKNPDPNAAAYYMRYEMGFDENGKPSLAFDRERLVRRSANPVWLGPIHETISFEGESVRTGIAIEHRKIKGGDADRNLRIYEKTLAGGKKLSARDQFYYSRELMYHERYEEACRGFEEFLADQGGWIENRISASLDLARSRKALGDLQGQLSALAGSFLFAPPRAEVLTEIGAWWIAKGDYKAAKGWYLAALAQEPDFKTGAFVSVDCYGYIPAIQLSVCFWKLGEMEKSCAYNEKAGSYKPQDANYLSNKAFFASKGYGEEAGQAQA